MTVQDVIFLVREYDKLKRVWDKNLFTEYYSIMPTNYSPRSLRDMSLEEFAEMINSHYGVYQVNDIVNLKTGVPVIITFIDDREADDLHEVKYHILYPYGFTDIISIDDIISKEGSVNEFSDKLNEYLNKYY